jgi:hypothetical protein
MVFCLHRMRGTVLFFFHRIPDYKGREVQMSIGKQEVANLVPLSLLGD